MLTNVEQHLLHALKLELSSNDLKHNEKIKMDRMKFCRKDINLSKLKNEFMNLHTFFKKDLEEEFKSFYKDKAAQKWYESNVAPHPFSVWHNKK